jgi:hypothetical protein
MGYQDDCQILSNIFFKIKKNCQILHQVPVGSQQYRRMLKLFFLSYVVDSQILAKSSSGQNCH